MLLCSAWMAACAPRHAASSHSTEADRVHHMAVVEYTTQGARKQNAIDVEKSRDLHVLSPQCWRAVINLRLFSAVSGPPEIQAPIADRPLNV